MIQANGKIYCTHRIRSNIIKNDHTVQGNLQIQSALIKNINYISTELKQKNSKICIKSQMKLNRQKFLRRRKLGRLLVSKIYYKVKIINKNSMIQAHIQ